MTDLLQRAGVGPAGELLPVFRARVGRVRAGRTAARDCRRHVCGIHNLVGHKYLAAGARIVPALHPHRWISRLCCAFVLTVTLRGCFRWANTIKIKRRPPSKLRKLLRRLARRVRRWIPKRVKVLFSKISLRRSIRLRRGGRERRQSQWTWRERWDSSTAQDATARPRPTPPSPVLSRFALSQAMSRCGRHTAAPTPPPSPPAEAALGAWASADPTDAVTPPPKQAPVAAAARRYRVSPAKADEDSTTPRLEQSQLNHPSHGGGPAILGRRPSNGAGVFGVSSRPGGCMLGAIATQPPANNGSSTAAPPNPFARRGTNSAMLAGGFAGKLKRKGNKIQEKRRQLELRSKSAIWVVRASLALCRRQDPYTTSPTAHPPPATHTLSSEQDWLSSLAVFAAAALACELDSRVDFPWCHVFLRAHIRRLLWRRSSCRHARPVGSLVWCRRLDA